MAVFKIIKKKFNYGKNSIRDKLAKLIKLSGHTLESCNSKTISAINLVCYFWRLNKYIAFNSIINKISKIKKQKVFLKKEILEDYFSEFLQGYFNFVLTHTLTIPLVNTTVIIIK